MIPKREPGIQRQQQLPGAQRGLFHPGEAHAQRLLDRAAVVVAAGVSGEPQQGGDGQAGAAGNRRVEDVFLAGDERFVVAGSVEEPAGLGVGKPRQHGIGQPGGFVQPARIRLPFVKRNQGVAQAGMIVEEGVVPRLARAPTVQQAPRSSRTCARGSPRRPRQP